MFSRLNRFSVFASQTAEKHKTDAQKAKQHEKRARQKLKKQDEQENKANQDQEWVLHPDGRVDIQASLNKYTCTLINEMEKEL
jgi:hypothetical protein